MELQLTRLRAAIVATGSELVRGDRNDLNGPFLARALLALGLDPVEITIVGDRADELERVLRGALEHDLVVISGGLGPTHDDRTVEVLARAAGLELRRDEALRAEIEERSRGVARRLRRPVADFAEGIDKQATIPVGALVAGLAGTAPALVVSVGGCVAVTLPGPPSELQRLWPLVLATEPLQVLLSRAEPPLRAGLRFFGVSESAVAQALADAGGDGGGVDVTICAHDFEIHVDLVAGPGAAAQVAMLGDALAQPLQEHLYVRGTDPPGVAELVLELCRGRGLTLATAESCTGGMVGERLTGVPGASDVFVGSIVAYSDAVKASALGVPEEVLRAHGAVSVETAAAMAQGARARLGADVAVSVTGIAGPGGGSAEKPVGLVYVHAAGPDGERAASFTYPTDRETIRKRATATALHLVRKLVTES